MNAADVLAQAEDDWIDEEADPEATDTALLYPFQVAALLAHGEQGVAILPDGTLMALQEAATDFKGKEGPDGEWHFGPLYRLVPLSAEAGDKVPNAGPWPPTHWPARSAEAGDTRITGLTADEADRVKRTKWLHGNCKCVETQALLAIIDRLTESPQ